MTSVNVAVGFAPGSWELTGLPCKVLSADYHLRCTGIPTAGADGDFSSFVIAPPQEKLLVATLGAGGNAYPLAGRPATSSEPGGPRLVTVARLHFVDRAPVRQQL